MEKMAGVAGLEPVTSAVTGQRSNQLSYTPAWGKETLEKFCRHVKFCSEKFFDRFANGIRSQYPSSRSSRKKIEEQLHALNDSPSPEPEQFSSTTDFTDVHG